MTQRARSDDLRGLRRFREVYRGARTFFVYTGSRRWREAEIEVLPARDALGTLGDLIG